MSSVHVPSESYRQLRHLTGLRDTFVQDIVAMKLRIKAMLPLEGLEFLPAPPGSQWSLIACEFIASIPILLYSHTPQYMCHAVDMEPTQNDAYRSFQEELLTELRNALNQGSKRLLGVYLQALLGYSDSPWVHETIKDKNSGRVLAESAPLPEKIRYPKEIELLRICAEAKRDQRKTVVYCVHTETRDITERLTKILGEAGLEAQVLKAAKVKAAEREEWINAFRGDVLITHPRNVQTGLDLIQFPEVVWYQQDYSIYTVRQPPEDPGESVKKNP